METPELQLDDRGFHPDVQRWRCVVAKRRRIAQVRRCDAVARLGGDEFAVLLPACPPGTAICAFRWL